MCKVGLNKLISLSFLLLLLSTVALSFAAAITDTKSSGDVVLCPMDEDEQEEESRTNSNKTLEDDIVQTILVNQHIFFTSLITQKHMAYIRNYVSTVFDVPTEPPELIG